jgi:hypothetical protein
VVRLPLVARINKAYEFHEHESDRSAER